MLLQLFVALGLNAATEKNSVKETEASERQDQQEVNVHIDIHKGIDFRVTVFLLGFLTILGAIIKDGRGLLPDTLAKIIATVCIAGIVASGTSLYVSVHGVRAAKSTPAERRKVMHKITMRKALTSNFALLCLVIAGSLFGLGFFWF